MLTWAAYRDRVRRTILDDAIVDGNDPKWSNDQLLDCVRWSLQEFAAHTAVATATSFTMDGETTQIVVPEHAYESLIEAGMLTVTENDSLEYLKPSRRVLGTTEVAHAGERSFWEWPRNILNLTFIPIAGAVVEVCYFALYNAPVNDNDIINIPAWAEQAVAYLMGAAAMAGKSVQTADIRRWLAKPDSGTPIQNSLIQQTDHFRLLYEQVVQKHPPQQRENLTQWQ